MRTLNMYLGSIEP